MEGRRGEEDRYGNSWPPPLSNRIDINRTEDPLTVLVTQVNQTHVNVINKIVLGELEALEISTRKDV